MPRCETITHPVPSSEGARLPSIHSSPSSALARIVRRVRRSFDFQNNCEVDTITAPIWAYWSIPNSDGTYTVSLLAQGTIDEGGGGVNLVAFPVHALMTDLFTNLQVLPADITFQRFGWDKIPNPPNNDMC